jgi:hypothetical protein
MAGIHFPTAGGSQADEKSFEVNPYQCSAYFPCSVAGGEIKTGSLPGGRPAEDALIKSVSLPEPFIGVQS